MAPAYVIADIEVTDAKAYEQYKLLSTRAINESGGRVLVRGGPVHPLEGDWTPSRLVLIEFASVEAAKRFYDSETYRQARTARANAARMRLLVAEGVPAV